MDRMRRPRFTLIEMLVVITIIVILIGIALPVFVVVTRRAKKTETQFRIQQMQTAIASYNGIYQYYPFFPANGGADVIVNTDVSSGSSTLIRTLRGTDGSTNPRRITFLDIQTTDYTDSWGNDFFVALDLGGDGQLDANKVYGSGLLSTEVAIWSKGPDGEHNSTDGDSTNTDNVNSWKSN